MRASRSFGEKTSATLSWSRSHPSSGLRKLVGRPTLITVKESGGKYLFTNHADLH